MEKRVYEKIYENLNSIEDIGKIHGEGNIAKAVLYSILSNKIVEDTKSRYHILRAESESLSRRWDSGESFLDISKSLNFPPVLTASLILQRKNFSKKGFQRLLKGITPVKDERLIKEVKEAVSQDFIYSPWAHGLQKRRAEAGEGIIMKWLAKKNAEFTSEKDCKGNRKTPDFLLVEPIRLKHKEIFWIDSKAMFGSEREHAKYIKKQFRDYKELFGPGTVVYWYGFVDSIKDMDNGTLVLDQEIFQEFNHDIEKLLNLIPPL